jgi:hypothetical protein
MVFVASLNSHGQPTRAGSGRRRALDARRRTTNASPTMQREMREM